MKKVLPDLLISTKIAVLCLSFFSGAQSLLAQSSPVTQKVYSLLYQKTGAVTTLMDGAMALYAPGYNSGVDYDDAIKMLNPGINASYRRDGVMLAIERRGTVTANDSLFLNLSNAPVHQYQWDIAMTNMAGPDRTAYLADQYSGQFTPLALNGTTSIVFDITNAPASAAADRFMIVFLHNTAALLPVRFRDVSATRNADKTVAVKWTAEDETGILNYKTEYSSNGTDFIEVGTNLPAANNGGSASYVQADVHAGAANNFYRVKAISLNGQVQYTPMIKVAVSDLVPAFSIYPNPVVGGVINLRFENEPAGTYTIQVMNISGQILKTEKVQVAGNNSLRIIELNNGSRAGSYRLKITNSEGKSTSRAFLVK